MKWLLCSVLALGLVACGDDDGAAKVDAGHQGGNDSGTTDSGASGDGAVRDSAVVSCGPLTGRTDTCDECLQTNCCEPLRACGGDVHCVGLVECLRACDGGDASTTCMSDCVGVHNVSVAYNPLILCGDADCETECPFSSP